MNNVYRYFNKLWVALSFILLISLTANAQTDADAVMLNKNNFCTGVMYSQGSWKEYWEGSFKRENLNLGTVTTRMYGFLGNYGLSDKINLLFSLPYVTTNASGGTMKGMKGLQDLSLIVKWMPLETKMGTGIFSVYGIGGLSFPVTDYVADFLPLSIGMHSKNTWLRAMADFQAGDFFVTASGIYIRRSNIDIDRTSYYTTEINYSNEVRMPDAAGYNFRTGFRSNRWIAEAIIENFTTLGGFDIRKNDMPFPSNRMIGTSAGFNVKYTFRAVKGLELTGGGNYVLRARNMGQSTILRGGVFYIMDFSKYKSVQINKKGQS